MTYDYLTLTPAPADAGAFSGFGGFSASPPSPASMDLDEGVLSSLADALQGAMERHGRESAEFAEAKAGAEDEDCND